MEGRSKPQRDMEGFVLRNRAKTNPSPRPEWQDRRLAEIDIAHKDLFTRMDADIKYRVDHKAWEKRQFDKDHLGK